MTTDPTNPPSVDEIVAFLCGEECLEGIAFGELHPDRMGPFWWRPMLRDAITALRAKNARLEAKLAVMSASADIFENRATRAEAERDAAHERGMDEAADKIFVWLANADGGQDYTPCDGTEEWDGDVHGTIYAILKAGRVLNDEDGRVAKIDDKVSAEAEVARLTQERDAALAGAVKIDRMKAAKAIYENDLMADEHEFIADHPSGAWCLQIVDTVIASLQPDPDRLNAHPDDLAVDNFADAMKAKLEKKRAEGRGGWEGPTCTAEYLSHLLREHVEKGDPLDVGNLAMMLHQRGERIQAAIDMRKIGGEG